MIETNIFNLLAGIGTISALVGGRIYPITMPENDHAKGVSITFRNITDPSNMTMGGPSGTENPTFQFDLWGLAHPDVTATRDALAKYLENYSGVPGSGGIMGFTCTNKMTNFERETRLFRATLDYKIWYETT